MTAGGRCCTWSRAGEQTGGRDGLPASDFLHGGGPFKGSLVGRLALALRIRPKRSKLENMNGLPSHYGYGPSGKQPAEPQTYEPGERRKVGPLLATRPFWWVVCGGRPARW